MPEENDRNYPQQYQQLLRDLKSTTENLLLNQVANVWCVYGGLTRLHGSVDAILKHGCKIKHVDSYWGFAQAIEHTQSDNNLAIDCEYKSDLPVELKNSKGSVWLYRNLENHFLSNKLSGDLPLEKFYHPYAFLCQEKYLSAVLICLKAIERNQPSLLSEIDPNLFLDHFEGHVVQKTHRRCSSFPEGRFPIRKISKDAVCNNNEDDIETGIDASIENLLDNIQRTNRCSRCKSLPNCSVRNVVKVRSNSLPSSFDGIEISADFRAIKTKESDLHKKVKHVLIDNYDIIEHTPPLHSCYLDKFSKSESFATKSDKSVMATSPMEYTFSNALSGQKDEKRQPKKRFIEDGGMSVLPMATGYFPRPKQGQTLTAFLTSSNFTRSNAELDRENAHFSISEAMIAAMEQIRCKKDLHLADDDEETDEEIMTLKQRIRLRRRQKLQEKQRKLNVTRFLCEGKTETATETSVSPCSTTTDSVSDSISSDGVEDLEMDDTSNLSDQKGLCMSMASLYSEADIFKRPRGAPDGASDILSAEGVALSLISKFKDKQLPRASDLEWLVSEEDAPQALLPLPKSLPISPDENEEITPLRGTNEWAPPRPQIIFTLHPSPSRKEILEKQTYRCASCSMRVAPQYASRFRYCNYLGKYFCTGCHTNQLALIPARVIQKWDFTRYHVSNFSYRLLEQMYEDPLFRIFELNKNIGKRTRKIELCRRYRLGLYYLKDFIFTCRFSGPIRKVLEKQNSYMLTDPDIYSMQDLVNVRSGQMKEQLKYLIEICCRHTAICELCLARGFICEVCQAKEILFPWQLRKVSRCLKCGSCFHIKCWDPSEKTCPRCDRRVKRIFDRPSTSKQI